MPLNVIAEEKRSNRIFQLSFNKPDKILPRRYFKKVYGLTKMSETFLENFSTDIGSNCFENVLKVQFDFYFQKTFTAHKFRLSQRRKTTSNFPHYGPVGLKISHLKL